MRELLQCGGAAHDVYVPSPDGGLAGVVEVAAGAPTQLRLELEE